MNEPDILPQQERENPDPYEGTNPVPLHLIVLTGLLVAFGILYIAQADIDTPGSWGDGRLAAELSGNPASTVATADGAALYASLCAACHQSGGQGLPGVFPPLAGSEWVLGNETTAAAILLNGIAGPLTVGGTTYNGAMPSFKEQLGDTQIAAVLSHIRSQWGNGAAAVTAETIARVREQHKDRTTPFSGDQDL
ncbi:MAG: cytochrome c, partial [Burkholderiales bacterium]|nr:cytochrome c [Burkholderiales bacterium]